MDRPGLSGDNEDFDRFLEDRFGQLVKHEYERGMASIERFLSQSLEVSERLEREAATLFDMHETLHHDHRETRHETPFGPVTIVTPREYEADPERAFRTCACGHFTRLKGEHTSAYTYAPRVHHTLQFCGSSVTMPEPDLEPDTWIPAVTSAGLRPPGPTKVTTTARRTRRRPSEYVGTMIGVLEILQYPDRRLTTPSRLVRFDELAR